MSDLRRQAIDLFDAFTHGHGDRRRFMRDLAAVAGSVAAAEALAAAIAPSPAAAAVVDPADARLVTRRGSYAIDGGRQMTGYFAVPREPGRKLAAVMVIHENRGLNAHIEDVTRRVALEGFFAVAPDFLSFQGGTPADADAARNLIGQVDYPAVVSAGVATLRRLKRLRTGNGRTGTIGFCWGGAMVHRVAASAGDALDAAVS
ncbi:MAG: dienelactone hydrolase family protein, partial [Staphylococcus hominis]